MLASLSEFLTPEHRQALKQLAQRLDPLISNAGLALRQCLSSLGASRSAIKEVKLLFLMIEEYHTGKKPVLTQLIKVAKLHTAAWSLLSYFVTEWRRINWTQQRPLPYHYRRAQILAIQQRFHIMGGIPREAAHVWFCPRCRLFYSIVIHFAARPCKQHHLSWCPSCHKHYEFGYEKIVMDYYTGQCYCSSKHVPKKAAALAAVEEDEVALPLALGEAPASAAAAEVLNVPLVKGVHLTDVMDWQELQAPNPRFLRGLPNDTNWSLFPSWASCSCFKAPA